MSWSGGKDSALALYHARRDPRRRVTQLLTNVNAHHERVSMHGVRTELLVAQAQRLGLPLRQLRLPESPAMADYEQALGTALAEAQAQGVAEVVYGDIFLEDLRAYREQQLARAGLRGHFPLWQRSSAELLTEFWALGFRAVVVCVSEQQLDASFCGRLLDADFVRDLPPDVDACGENGEYHSFVFDGPDFSSPVPLTLGERVRRAYPAPGAEGAEMGFWFCDLLPATP